MMTTGSQPSTFTSLMELEPRLMYDGAAVATAADVAAESAPTSDAHESGDGEQAQAAESDTPDSAAQGEAPTEADGADAVTNALLALGAPAATADGPRQVFIIDGRIADKDSILDAIPEGADVHILSPDADGVAAIADILDQYSDLDAVHVISHGGIGTVLLGSTTLESGTAASHAEALGRWGSALTEAGDILLYGCATGSGDGGQAFLDTVADLTGADVAASDDATGAAERGGDWDLERSNGVIETDAIEADGFSGLLVTTPENGRHDFSNSTTDFLYPGDNGGSGAYGSTFVTDDFLNGEWTAEHTPPAGLKGALTHGQTQLRYTAWTTDGVAATSVGEVILRTSSGNEIDILEITLDGSLNDPIHVVGYRNGVAIPGYSRTVDHVWSVHSKAVLAWENVDELRFSSSRPADQGLLNMSIGIVSILVGPIPTLNGTLPGAANALVEGENGALNLAPLTFTHDDTTSTNLSIKANSGTLSGSSSGSVTVTGSGTDTLTLTGSAADIDAWLNTSANITYNSGILSGPDALVLSFSSTYDGVKIDLGTRTVSVADVEQKARFEALPSSFPGRVDVAKALDFSSANLIDPDSNGTDFRFTLSVASGTLNVAGSYGGVTVTGMGTDTLVVSGRPTSVETWLNTASRITYTGAAEGPVQLTISGYDTVNGDYTIATTEIDVAPANTAPTVTGIPSVITMTEDTAGSLDLSGLTISDPDSSGTFTIRIDAGSLTIEAASADGVTATRTGIRYLTLTGTIPALTAYLGDPSRISLTPRANVNGTNYGTISVGVDDGDDNIVTSNIQVDITPVDDPSTLTGTLDRVSATEDATTDTSSSGLDLSSLTFSDLDAGPHTLILTVEHGVLFFQAFGGLVVDGNNTNRLTITGTASQINSYFLGRSGDYFRYAPETNLYGTGADTLTISVPGVSGGDDVVLRGIAIDIAGVNDAPTLTGLPTSFTVTVNQLSPLDLSSVTLADIDSSGPDFRLTLWAQSGGFLQAESTATVTVTGSGTSTLVVTGRVSDITAWLNSGTPIGYQSIPNKTGTTVDMIRFSGNDGDGSAVTFTNKMVNAAADPAPKIPAMGNAPATITVTEETLGAVDLTGITLTEGDSPAASKTLQISVGKGILTGAAGAGVVVTGGGTRILTVTGALADLEAWLASADKIQYLGDVDVAGNAADTLVFKISNGAGTTQTVMDTVAINITNVNDLPNPTGFPTVVTAQENTRAVLDLSALKLNDPDTTTQFRVVLTASGGQLRYSGTLPPGLTISGTGTGILTLNGFPSLVETFLNDGRITYTPPTGATGAAVATINLTINDNGGSGVVNVATATVNIAPPNDAPTLSGLPTSVTAVEDTASTIDLSGLTVSDADSPGAGFALTLSVNAGTLTAATAGGVTVTGSGTAAVTLTGTVTAINAFLNDTQAITYTGAENAYGTAAATLTVTATDGDGNIGVALGSVGIDITNVNDPAGTDSLPARVTATEDTQSGLNLSGVVLSTIDPLDASHKLVLSVDKGTLHATGSGGVSVAGTGTGTLTLTGGRDAIQAWLAVNGNVSYQGTENLSGTGAATLTLKADDLDGGGEVTLGTVAIDITGVNDAPTVTGFPTTVTAVENTTGALSLSGLDLADIDSADNVSVVLSVTHGTLSITGTDPAFTVSGKGTASLTLTGPLADLETFLTTGRVTYTPATNALGTGVDSLVLTVNDLDGSGDIAGGTATINVVPPNDAPTLSGLPTSVTAVEDTATAIDLSGVTLADTDSPGAGFTLTLSVDAGTLAATAAGGVTVTGSGTAAVTLTGTVAAIDAFLNNTQALTYTGAENAHGTAAATLTVTAADGDGNTGVALGSVSIDVTPVNDAPVLSGLPTRIEATEDTPVGLDLSGVSFADADPSDGDFQLVITAGHGTLSATSAGGVTVQGSGTGTLTLSGAMGTIQAWLQNSSIITFQGAADAAGTDVDTLTLKADDMDGSGLRVQGTISVDITGVRDAPTIKDLPRTTTAYRGENTPLAFANTTILDADGDTETLTVTLTSDRGTLSATAGGGVQVDGSGTAAVVLTGTVSEINAFLGKSLVSFQTDAAAGGTAAFTVMVDDGNGGTASGAFNLAVLNRPPPPAPPPPAPSPSDASGGAPRNGLLDGLTRPLPPAPAPSDAPGGETQPTGPGRLPSAPVSAEGAGTPIRTALMPGAGAGNGQVPSAVVGQLGAVSPLERSDTPVQQALLLQGDAVPAPGGFTTPGFNGLGALGETFRIGTAGAGGFGSAAPDLDAPPPADGTGGDGAPPAPPADAADEAAEIADAAPEPPTPGQAEGHVGLTRQLAAATASAKAPASLITQALETLAASLRA